MTPTTRAHTKAEREVLKEIREAVKKGQTYRVTEHTPKEHVKAVVRLVQKERIQYQTGTQDYIETDREERA